MSRYDYPTLYENYKKFAVARDCPYWTFEDWMTKKDAPPQSKFKQTLDFLKMMEEATKSESSVCQ
jgi:peptidoglycan/xylan/chitin deacetylase (PgdA/CDA1 family)